jgi:hypothetical protein
MSFDFTKSRAAWRKVSAAARDLNITRNWAKRSLIHFDTAGPRVAFDSALLAAPNPPDMRTGHTWESLATAGIERAEVPEILKALGAIPEEINEATKSADAAFAAIQRWRDIARNPIPSELPSKGAE